MLNLTVEGAAVEAPDPLPVGAATFFIFVLDEHTAIECGGRVLYALPLQNKKYRIGLRFTRLSEAARKQLAQVTEAARVMQ